MQITALWWHHASFTTRIVCACVYECEWDARFAACKANQGPPQNNFHDSNGRISNQLTYILPSYLELHSAAANLTIYRSTSVLTHISCTFRYQFYIEICIWPVG